MILSALQRMVSIMDAKAISAAPFLSAAPIGAMDNQTGEDKPSKK